MHDWMVVIVGGALASLLATVLHRRLPGWLHHGDGRSEMELPPSLTAPTVTESARPESIEGSQPRAVHRGARSRAEQLASQIERDERSLSEARKRDSDRGAGWVLSVSLMLAPFVFITASENRPKAAFWIAVFSVVFWFAYRLTTRETRRLQVRIKRLQELQDQEFGLRDFRSITQVGIRSRDGPASNDERTGDERE